MKLPNIEIKINGVDYDHNFDEDVRIDRTNLDEEFATQAVKYSFYAFLAEEAKFQADRKKSLMENLYARIDAEKRANAATIAASGSKMKYTEKMCENEVKTDPRYTVALEDYHKAKLLAGQLDVFAKAIAMRRDMLMQMGATSRVGMAPTRVLETQKEHAKEVISSNRRRRRQ